MQRRRFIRLLAGGASLALGVGAGACTYRNDYPRSGWYRYPYAYYDYYYYPGVNVYFHIYTGYYYYYDDGRWLRVRVLPRHIHLNPAHRRRFHIRSSHPYERNQEHRREWERQRELERRRDTERREPAPGEPRRPPPEGSPEVRRERQMRTEPRPQAQPELRRDRPDPAQPRTRRPDDAEIGAARPVRPEQPPARPETPDEQRARRVDRTERGRIESESRRRRREAQDWPVLGLPSD